MTCQAEVLSSLIFAHFHHQRGPLQMSYGYSDHRRSYGGSPWLDKLPLDPIVEQQSIASRKLSRPDGPSSSLKASTEQSKYSPIPKIILLVLPIVLFTAGPAILLLCYVFIINRWQADGALAVRSTASLQFVLGIPTLTTFVVSRSVPIVVSAHAYELASEWLKGSSESSADQPSPLQ